jgi:hypothetical protein
VRLGFGIQGLVENFLGLPDTLDGLIDAILALCDLCVGILGLLGQFGAQCVGLAHQGFGLRVFLLAIGIARLRFELGDLRNRLLGLLAGVFAALGFTGLRTGHLRGQVHRFLGELPGLLELAIGQRLAGLPLVLGDLALAIFRRLEVGHALATDVADTFLRRHRELALLLLDALDFGQMPVGLGVKRIDVLPVLGQRLRHRLALGGQDVVFNPLDVGATLFLGLALAARRLDPGLGLIVNEFQRVCRGLPAQRGLLGQGIGQQLRRLGDQRCFGLLGCLQRRLFLLVARLDRFNLRSRLASTMDVRPL